MASRSQPGTAQQRGVQAEHRTQRPAARAEFRRWRNKRSYGGRGAEGRGRRLQFSLERRQEEVSQCQPYKVKGRSAGFMLRARVGVNTCSGVNQLVSQNQTHTRLPKPKGTYEQSPSGTMSAGTELSRNLYCIYSENRRWNSLVWVTCPPKNRMCARTHT